MVRTIEGYKRGDRYENKSRDTESEGLICIY